MSIIIQNITSGSPDLDHYRLRVNDQVICEFDHQRGPDKLAQCLRDAADAVEAERKRSYNEMLKNLVGRLGP